MGKHDRDILRALEHAGNITTEPPAECRPKRKGELILSGGQRSTTLAAWLEKK
jgi:hypothetical protein